MFTIGVDLGGTTIKIGLVENDRLLAHNEIEAEADIPFSKKLPHIEDTISWLLSENNISSNNLGGIGMAFPSIIDSRQMKILSKYVKYTDADELDLPSWAHKAWNIPLILENDARAALIGEWRIGAGKGVRNLVFMTLGTGVGSAAMMDGKLLRGAHFIAGNLGGHTIINVYGNKCNCGSFGCVETEASGWVLASKFANHPGVDRSEWISKEGLTFEAVFKHARKGDSLAIEIRDYCLKAWAAAAINLVHAFDPEVMIIGGGIMKSHDQIIPFIQEYVDKYTWLPAGSVRIVPAQQVKFAGILGMGYLARNL